MASFLLALQFLTIIPLKIKGVDDKNIASSMIYFPLVGILLGAVLIALNYFFSVLRLPLISANIILVVSLAILTGGMHLDGLSDTADAFLSGKSKDEMLVIMRDPHIGVMGVLSLISAIILKIALLFSINSPLKFTALILMCVLSRWSVVPVMFFFPYARTDGKAGVFIRGMNLKILVLSTIVSAICAFLVWHINGLIVLLITAAAAYAFGKFASRKIGGITGDTLGATIELTELVILLTICITGGAFYG